ncbi:MAG: hypothetical protein AB7R69_01155 [Candidatus Babeliales bacterium]
MRRIYVVLFLCIFKAEALTLDRVILSTDANPNYIEYWPLVAKMWKEVVGIRPTLALIADKSVEIDESLGDIIRFEPIPGIPTSLYAQCIRLFLPLLFPNDCCIVSDIDLLPLSRDYFTERIKDLADDVFVVYRDSEEFERQFKEIPMCYVAGKGKIFAEIFKIFTKEDIPQKIKEWHDTAIGWTTDQKMLYKTVLAWDGYESRCIRLGKTDVVSPRTRIDKINWRYDVGRIEEGTYVDCLPPRPYSAYKKDIDTIAFHACKQSREQLVRLLIKIPTRYRPVQFFQYLKKYYEMLSGTIPYHFLITCDQDDPTMNNAKVISILDSLPNLSYRFGNSSSKIEAYNKDIDDFIDKFDVILVVSDDLEPIVKNYDVVIVRQMLKHFPDFDGILNFSDGRDPKDYVIYPIIGRMYYKRFGYIYYPEYKSYYCDNELAEVARSLGKEKIFYEQLIKNNYPLDGSDHNDPLYVRNAQYFRYDQQLYQKRKLYNFGIV